MPQLEPFLVAGGIQYLMYQRLYLLLSLLGQLTDNIAHLVY